VTIGPVKVMGAGVALKPYVIEVSNVCAYITQSNSIQIILYNGCCCTLALLVSIYAFCFVSTDADIDTWVTIVSDPAGTRVSGTANTFDYPILSSVTLTCMVNPTPSVPVTYRWNTEGCYVHNVRGCFPAGQTTQSISEDDLIAIDAGTISCTAIIFGVEYTSNEFTLRISGMV